MTIKLLPCKNPRSADCRRRGFALWPPSRLHPEGEPAISGQFVSRYDCARCHWPTTLTLQEWNRLPLMEHTDHFDVLAMSFNSHEAREAIRRLPTGDFASYGIPHAQGRDLFNAGFRHVDELRALEPKREEASTS